MRKLLTFLIALASIAFGVCVTSLSAQAACVLDTSAHYGSISSFNTTAANEVLVVDIQTTLRSTAISS
jgi:hypothetical protein